MTAAIDRSLRRKRLRRRLVNRAAMVGMSGALIFVGMTPAVLNPATVAIEETQGALPMPYDRDTLARLCEPSRRNSAPACNDALPVIASRPAEQSTVGPAPKDP